MVDGIVPEAYGRVRSARVTRDGFSWKVQLFERRANRYLAAQG